MGSYKKVHNAHAHTIFESASLYSNHGHMVKNPWESLTDLIGGTKIRKKSNAEKNVQKKQFAIRISTKISL